MKHGQEKSDPRTTLRPRKFNVGSFTRNRVDQLARMAFGSSRADLAVLLRLAGGHIGGSCFNLSLALFHSSQIHLRFPC
jgi:hypothetical protein